MHNINEIKKLMLQAYHAGCEGCSDLAEQEVQLIIDDYLKQQPLEKGNQSNGKIISLIMDILEGNKDGIVFCPRCNNQMQSRYCGACNSSYAAKTIIDHSLPIYEALIKGGDIVI